MEPERREVVRLDRLDEPAVERTQLVRRRELPVAHVASGTPGDLADLGRGRARGPTPSNLLRPVEDHGVDVEVQPHADRVGR